MRPRSRSWRFRVPRLDAPPGEPVGLVLDPSGAIDTVADDEAVRQSLLMLISTRPGERVMRPEYGCDLHRLLFAPNDATTAGLAMHYVRRAIEQFETRVEILELTAGRADRGQDDERGALHDPHDGTLLRIDLVYRVKSTRTTDRLTLHMNLAEAPA